MARDSEVEGAKQKKRRRRTDFSGSGLEGLWGSRCMLVGFKGFWCAGFRKEGLVGLWGSRCML